MCVLVCACMCVHVCVCICVLVNRNAFECRVYNNVFVHLYLLLTTLCVPVTGAPIKDIQSH